MTTGSEIVAVICYVRGEVHAKRDEDYLACRRKGCHPYQQPVETARDSTLHRRFETFNSYIYDFHVWINLEFGPLQWKTKNLEDWSPAWPFLNYYAQCRSTQQSSAVASAPWMTELLRLETENITKLHEINKFRLCFKTSKFNNVSHTCLSNNWHLNTRQRLYI